MEEHFLPYALEWENEGTVPEHVWHLFNKHNMLLPNLKSPLPIKWLRRLGLNDILGVPIEEWDYLHTAIWVDERARTGISGPGASLSPGFAYGIPPILSFGSEELQARFLPELLPGKKRCCIAITEPHAGSDVANIQTTAKKSADGKYYVINGEKKWITNGIWSDYATMAVRTSGRGPSGISVIVVPLKGHPGVTMRRLKVVSFHPSSSDTWRLWLTQHVRWASKPAEPPISNLTMSKSLSRICSGSKAKA